MLKPGMLVEKTDIDAFWVVPEFEGFGIVIGEVDIDPLLHFYGKLFLVLWNDGHLLRIDNHTLQPYGTRHGSR